jgi:hypothetical protein
LKIKLIMVMAIVIGCATIIGFLQHFQTADAIYLEPIHYCQADIGFIT